MSDAPEVLRSAVEAVASVPVLDALATAVTHKFPQPDGRVIEAPVWILRTSGQLWSVAVAGEDRFLAATGDAGAVSVVRGWARDEVRIGPRALTLPRKTGDAAEALVTAFKADAGGASYPPPASPPVVGPVAAGAAGLPEWWATAVPGDPEDPWLHGHVLSTTWTFNADDGTARTAPLVVGVRGRGVVVAAQGAGQVFSEAVQGPATVSGAIGRSRLDVGRFHLEGGVLDSPRVALLGKLINADEAGRWALVAAAAMDEGRVGDAASLWRSALQRGHRAAVAEDLAAAAAGADRGAQAVALLKGRSALEDGWPARRAAWTRGVSRAPAPVAALIDAMVEPAPAPGDGWPWPPVGLEEVWAAVRGAPLTSGSARAPRRLQIEAALAEQSAAPSVAAAAFRVAARAWAAQGELRTAYRTLTSAVRLDPDGADDYQAAVWAYGAGDATEGGAHLRAGLDRMPTAEALLALDPPVPVLRAAADIAQAAGHARTAARLLIRAEAATLTNKDARLALARRAAVELKAPREAALLIEEAAEQEEREADLEASTRTDESAPEDLWLQAAALHARGGDPERATAARQRAVQAGFLSAEVYRAAAADDASMGDWWHHLGHVLAGGTPRGAARPPVEKLPRASLDGLHPGGEGWLANVKQWMDGPAPPARDTLIRGLERLERATFPEAFEAVNDVSQRLEMMPPPTYVYRGDDAYGVSAWPVTPPVLLIGHQHLVEGPRQLTGAALTFALAVELVHLAAEHPLLRFESSLVGTSTSAYATFGRFAGTAETVVDLVSLVPGIDQIAKLERIVRLSRRVLTGWKQVDKASKLATPVVKWLGMGEGADAGGVGREKLEGAALQFRLQADRAALLLTGDAGAAVEAVLKMSGRSVVKLEAVRRDGLAPLLRAEKDALAPDELVRLSALLGWCAGLGPDAAFSVDRSSPGV